MRVHHIVDPRSGAPRPRSGARSAWPPHLRRGRSASTAAIVRGEGAIGWLERAGLPARLVRPDGTTVTTGGWPEEAAA